MPPPAVTLMVTRQTSCAMGTAFIQLCTMLRRSLKSFRRSLQAFGFLPPQPEARAKSFPVPNGMTPMYTECGCRYPGLLDHPHYGAVTTTNDHSNDASRDRPPQLMQARLVARFSILYIEDSDAYATIIFKVHLERLGQLEKDLPSSSSTCWIDEQKHFVDLPS
eukprot:CAMPEP_0170598646 /NCGR_PEP_ID=MMETSP0224-20130122/16360_1 /TAXON_ID=285029 /ORGANISM="Togula jolla, Strain CCCM 725" /LENGTH=163 /DNA_ID=CAMNT_0010923215 /DNA_START=794 /DNA_END=1283 /DNA_ORIENTATION=-